MGSALTFRLGDIISMEELSAMGRRRGQWKRKLYKTTGGRPQWYFMARADRLDHESGRPNKKRPEKPFYLGYCDEQTLTEAKRQQQEVLREVINKPLVNIPSQVKFADVLAIYKRDHLSELRETTRADQEGAIRKHIEPAFGALRMCDIDALAVQRWISGMGLAQRTRKQLVTLMRCVWNRAEEWGFVQRSFPKARYVFGGPQNVKGREMATMDQLRRLLAALPDPFRAMAEIALYCGLRISEIRGLKWEDVGPQTLTVRRRLSQAGAVGPTKTGKVRVFDIRPLQSVFARLPKDGVYIFGRGTGYCACKEAMQEARKAAGITVARFGWHHLRAACNTLLRDRGADTADRQALLGHSTEEMNAVYIHATDEDLRRRGDLMMAVRENVAGDAKGTVQ